MRSTRTFAFSAQAVKWALSLRTVRRGVAHARTAVYPAGMGCLHIEDVPDELADVLARIARRQHESVSHIVVTVLRRALLSPDARQTKLFPRGGARRRRASKEESA